ncbi:uncharacterized protein [Watersipora subatra]|uniref:uncharacterized protein n=1 Tax=Watersipora subatra TaxID=2589382 RepID=UPI00355B904F
MSWNNEEKYFYLTFDALTLIPGYCIAYKITTRGGDVEYCRALSDETRYYQVPSNINHFTATRTVSTTMISTMIMKAASSGSRSKSLKKKLDYSKMAIVISLSIVGLVILFIGIICSVALNKWMKQRRTRQRCIFAQSASRIVSSVIDFRLELPCWEHLLLGCHD